MANNKRYTWTVSVIALFDKNEPENGLVIVKAYEEFENSITSIKKANKDIKFVIYKFDISSKTVFIREATIIGNQYSFQTRESYSMTVEEFYKPPYQKLIDFFSNHVAKTKLSENEEHKHFLIVWGHAAGLGFLKTTIKNDLKDAFDMPPGAGGEDFDKRIQSTTEKIALYNYLKSQLSLKVEQVPYKYLLSDLLEKRITNDLPLVTDQQKKTVDALVKLVTAKEFADIIKEGLAGDTVSVTSAEWNVEEEKSPPPKIEVALCLSCYVNMVETGFILRNMVNVYIAPQTEISFFGYNYKKLFKSICACPAIDVNQICKNITHNYMVKYLEPGIEQHIRGGGTVIFDIDYKNGVSFAATYLWKYKRIAKTILLFRKFIESVLKDPAHVNNPGLVQMLKNARERCFPLTKSGATDSGILDYENYLIEGLFSITKKSDAIFPFLFSHGAIVADYNPGALCRSRYIIGVSEFRSQSPGSFSIFFPNLKTSPLEAQFFPFYEAMAKEENSFLDISKWHEVIELVNK